MSEPAPDKEALLDGLDMMQRQVERWVLFDKERRQEGSLGWDEDTHIIAPPHWPTYGQLGNWASALKAARQILNNDGASCASNADGNSTPGTGYNPSPNTPAVLLEALTDIVATIAEPNNAKLVNDAPPHSQRIVNIIATVNVRAKAALKTAQAQAPQQDESERCMACAVAFKAGDLVLDDVSGGVMHIACCGPERESYCDLETGEPLAPGAPIPTGYAWEEDPVVALLPRDVQVAHMTFRKGVKLQTFVDAAARWHAAFMATRPQQDNPWANQGEQTEAEFFTPATTAFSQQDEGSGAAQAFDAVDVADRLIEAAYGTDVPAEWDTALRAVADARAATPPLRGEDREKAIRDIVDFTIADARLHDNLEDLSNESVTRILAALALPDHAQAGGEKAIGWLYISDDGPEWSPNHPIETGEVPDARNLRAGTAKALQEELISTMEAYREGLVSEAQLRTRAHKAEAASAPVPEGFVLVPIEPTREMWAASGDAVNKFGHRLKSHHDRYSDAVWKAMVSASPAILNEGE